jgi:membrane-associated phospholipid phosphatase
MIETLRHIDHRLFHFINTTIANPFFDFLCPALRGKPFLFFFYMLLTAAIYRLYPRHFLKIAIAGAITFLLTDQLSATVLKPIFHRLRPCNNPEINMRLLTAYCGGGFSFVSAHAANSFGIAALVSTIRPRWQTILVLVTWASLVCFSQVYVGVHFPADVVGGAFLGGFIGTISGSVLRKLIDHEVV